MERVIEFTGEYRWLSNFYPCECFGFPSVEHFYVYSKFPKDLFIYDEESLENYIKKMTAGQAKKFGRENSHRVVDNWNDIKVKVMHRALRQKFHPNVNPILSNKLMNLKGEIIEGNGWGDTFWGVDIVTGEGDNRLGNILMYLRNELRRTGTLTPLILF